MGEAFSIMRVRIGRNDRERLAIFIGSVGEILCSKRLIAEILELFGLLALFFILGRERHRDGQQQNGEDDRFEGTESDHCIITVRSSPFLGVGFAVAGLFAGVVFATVWFVGFVDGPDAVTSRSGVGSTAML